MRNPSTPWPAATASQTQYHSLGFLAQVLERSPAQTVGHYSDLFVTRKHDPAQSHNTLSGTRRPVPHGTRQTGEETYEVKWERDKIVMSCGQRHI